jgi:hypothetical protein
MPGVCIYVYCMFACEVYVWVFVLECLSVVCVCECKLCGWQYECVCKVCLSVCTCVYVYECMSVQLSWPSMFVFCSVGRRGRVADEWQQCWDELDPPRSAHIVDLMVRSSAATNNSCWHGHSQVYSSPVHFVCSVRNTKSMAKSISTKQWRLGHFIVVMYINCVYALKPVVFVKLPRLVCSVDEVVIEEGQTKL